MLTYLYLLGPVAKKLRDGSGHGEKGMDKITKGLICHAKGPFPHFSFILTFSNYFFSTYYVPVIILGVGNEARNKPDKSVVLIESTF
jgi:hypothetical protein